MVHFMSQEFKTADEALGYALQGHANAMAFCTVLFHVLHVWDDLEDRDKPISRDELDRAMYAALVVLPGNPFYQAHFRELNLLLEVAIQNWHAANEMERRGSEQDKHIAFITRSSYCDLAIACARLVGGYEWARRVTPMLRRFWHAEGFEGYLQNLEKQFATEKELGHVL